METHTQTMQKPEERKSEILENFSERMTTGVALASGGAAVGAFLGPVGATVGALASGVVGFLVSGQHHDSKTHN